MFCWLLVCLSAPSAAASTALARALVKLLASPRCGWIPLKLTFTTTGVILALPTAARRWEARLVQGCAPLYDRPSPTRKCRAYPLAHHRAINLGRASRRRRTVQGATASLRAVAAPTRRRRTARSQLHSNLQHRRRRRPYRHLYCRRRRATFYARARARRREVTPHSTRAGRWGRRGHVRASGTKALAAATAQKSETQPPRPQCPGQRMPR